MLGAGPVPAVPTTTAVVAAVEVIGGKPDLPTGAAAVAGTGTATDAADATGAGVGTAFALRAVAVGALAGDGDAAPGEVAAARTGDDAGAAVVPVAVPLAPAADAAALPA